LSNLERLRTVEIKDAALVSLEGLGGGVEKLILNTSQTDNNTVLKVSDIKNMGGLEWFMFEGGKINLESIDRFTSMECLVLTDCEPYNLDSINRLKSLKYIYINLISPNPSIEFLRDMPNLESVSLFGNYRLYNYELPWTSFSSQDRQYRPTQALDVSPLATSMKLWDISCYYLIIKNISSLDVLDNISFGIQLQGSRLYDETEKSRHYFSLERVSDR
jgi:hypothetical protein